MTVFVLSGCSESSESDKISWEGEYSFCESSDAAESDSNMICTYKINIYEENNKLYGEIAADGFQTMERIMTEINESDSKIDFVFSSYLHENVTGEYEKGDVLLSFERKNGGIVTVWNEMKPMLTEHYSSGIYFEKDSEEKFIDNEAFEYIKTSYKSVDFSSDFMPGNTENYEYYKKQYLRLLNCESAFTVPDTAENYFLNEYSEFKNNYSKEDYTYYFFDADCDSFPELCIKNQLSYTFKYNAGNDEFILWNISSSTWTEWLGSRKQWLYSGTSPVYYAFYQLDQNGGNECKIQFYAEPRSDSDTIYMLTLPEFSDNSEPPENIKNQSLEKDSHFYYRVTENQWNQLTKDFFDAKETAKENIKSVRYDYNELFDE